MDSITIHVWFLFDHEDPVSKKHRPDPKANEPINHDSVE